MAYRKTIYIGRKLRALPWPAKERTAFLGALHRANGRAYAFHFKGADICKKCGVDVGRGDYIIGGTVWAESLGHQIKVHGMRPTDVSIRRMLRVGKLVQ